jgi:hypothetical protein
VIRVASVFAGSLRRARDRALLGFARAFRRSELVRIRVRPELRHAG